MKLAKRTEDEIKRITVLNDIEKLRGWAVIIDYKDGKSAAFSVDEGRRMSMLDYTVDAIKKQMAGNDG